MSKFVALVSHYTALYALDADGQIWSLILGESGKWRLSINAREEPEKNPEGPPEPAHQRAGRNP